MKVCVILPALCVWEPISIPLPGILAAEEMEEAVGRKIFLLNVTCGKQTDWKQIMNKLVTRTLSLL